MLKSSEKAAANAKPSTTTASNGGTPGAPPSVLSMVATLIAHSSPRCIGARGVWTGVISPGYRMSQPAHIGQRAAIEHIFPNLSTLSSAGPQLTVVLQAEAKGCAAS